MNKKQVLNGYSLLCAALLGATVPALAQAEMSVDWTWKVAHRCNNTSPELAVTNIPAGTASFAVQMNDLDFQNKDHGGGSLPHAGGASATIAEGALKSYLGPCPNNFYSFGHSYRIAVRALAADGSELGQANKAKDFSASTAK